MKTIKTCFLFMVFSVFLISCGSESEFSNPKSKNLILTLNAKDIANEHNLLLTEILSIQSKSTKSSINNAIFSLNVDLSKKDKQGIFDWSLSMSIEEHETLILSEINTSLARSYYKEIDEAIDASFSNPSKLSTSISSILSNAENKIANEVDLQILKIFGETSIASSAFWYGQNKEKNKTLKKYKINDEQEGEGEDEDQSFEDQSVEGGGSSDWVKADGKGAASASISWAVGAAYASGPVAPATYFIAVGLGAALASIMS